MAQQHKYDIVLLTEDRYESPKEITPYISNVLNEDKLVRNALEAKGLRVHRVSWSNPDFDWSSTKIALFRTTWDYFYRFEEFENWLKKADQQTQFINSPSLIHWNLHKAYLKELEVQNVRIPQTVIIEKGKQASLADLTKQFSETEYILKPCISGTARHTYRFDEKSVEQHELIFQELLAKEDMLLQPFLNSILTKGEVAHMVIGKEYSHSVLKRAKKGEFRVQDDFGGTTQLYQASPEEIQFAEAAVVACKYEPCYARVDVVWDNEDQLAVSEMEMIEPELWFRYCPEAATKLAQEIIEKYNL